MLLIHRIHRLPLSICICIIFIKKPERRHAYRSIEDVIRQRRVRELTRRRGLQGQRPAEHRRCCPGNGRCRGIAFA